MVSGSTGANPLYTVTLLTAGSRSLTFTRTEIELLERLVHDTPQNAQAPPMARNVIRLAQHGGYLARASDPPPGNTVMWRGMRRLTDTQIGYELALKEVCNYKMGATLTQHRTLIY
jgi:hypothetical protein